MANTTPTHARTMAPLHDCFSLFRYYCCFSVIYRRNMTGLRRAYNRIYYITNDFWPEGEDGCRFGSAQLPEPVAGGEGEPDELAALAVGIQLLGHALAAHRGIVGIGDD
jgi:hypothetical protein